MYNETEQLTTTLFLFYGGRLRRGGNRSGGIIGRRREQLTPFPTDDARRQLGKQGVDILARLGRRIEHTRMDGPRILLHCLLVQLDALVHLVAGEEQRDYTRKDSETVH